MSVRNEKEDELLVFKQEEMATLEELRYLNNGSGAKVIFSTRNRINPYGALHPQEVQADFLDYDKLTELFIKHCPKVDIKTSKDKIEELISTIERHTLVLVLAAGYLTKMDIISDKDIEILSFNLKKTAITLRNDINIINYKDRQPFNANIGTLYSHIKALLDLNGFNEEEKYILGCLCFMPAIGISSSFLKELCCNVFDNDEMSIAFAKKFYSEEITEFVLSNRYEDVITSFQHRNLIISRDNRIHCHTVLADVLFNELQPQIHGDQEVKFDGNENIGAKKAVDSLTRMNEKYESYYSVFKYMGKSDAEITDSILTLMSVDLMPYVNKSGLHSLFAINLWECLKVYGKPDEVNEVAQTICHIGFKYANATWASEEEIYAASALLCRCDGLLNFSKENYYVLLKLLIRTPNLPPFMKRAIKYIKAIIRSENTQQLLEIIQNMPTETTIEECENEIERAEMLSPFLESHAKAYLNFANNYYESICKNYLNAFICKIIGNQIFNLKNKVELRIARIEGCSSAVAIEESYHLMGISNSLSRLNFRECSRKDRQSHSLKTPEYLVFCYIIP